MMNQDFRAPQGLAGEAMCGRRRAGLRRGGSSLGQPACGWVDWDATGRQL
jgi:hypothetical protein